MQGKNMFQPNIQAAKWHLLLTTHYVVWAKKQTIIESWVKWWFCGWLACTCWQWWRTESKWTALCSGSKGRMRLWAITWIVFIHQFMCNSQCKKFSRCSVGWLLAFLFRGFNLWKIASVTSCYPRPRILYSTVLPMHGNIEIMENNKAAVDLSEK